MHFTARVKAQEARSLAQLICGVDLDKTEKNALFLRLERVKW